MAIEFQVKSDSRQARADVLKLQASIDGLNRHVEGINNRFQNLGKTINTVFAAVPIGLVGTAMIKTAAQFETFNARLKITTGSMENATIAMTELKKIVATTPFGIEALTSAYANLSASGKSMKELPGIISDIADVTAALGGTDVQFKQIATAWERINSEGRVTAERLNVLADAGVPITFIAEALGGTTAELRKLSEQGALSADAFNYAFNKIADTKFSGAAVASVNTLNGAFSNLSDAVVDLSDKTIRVSGLSKVIVGVVINITNGINRLAEGVETKVANLITTISSFYQKASIIASAIGTLFSAVGNRLQKEFIKIAANSVVIRYVFVPLINGIASIVKWVQTLAVRFNFTAEEIASRILGLASLIDNTIFGKLSIFMKNYEIVTAGIFDTINRRIMSTVTLVIYSVYQYIISVGTQILSGLSEIIDEVVHLFYELTEVGFGTFQKLFYFVDIDTGPLISTFNFASKVINNALNNIGASILESISFITEKVIYAFLILSKGLSDLVSLDNIVNKFKNFANSVVKVFMDLYNTLVGNSIWPDLLNEMYDLTNHVMTSIFSIFQRLYFGITGIIEDAIKYAILGGKLIKNGIENIFRGNIQFGGLEALSGLATIISIPIATAIEVVTLLGVTLTQLIIDTFVAINKGINLSLGILDAVIDTIQDWSSKVIDVFVNLYDTLVGHSIWPDTMESIKIETMNMVRRTIIIFTVWGMQVTKTLSSISDRVGRILQTLGNSFRALATFNFKEAFGGFIQAAFSAFGTISSAYLSFYILAIEGIFNLGEVVYGFAKVFVNSVIRIAKATYQSVKFLVEDISKLFTNLYSKIFHPKQKSISLPFLNDLFEDITESVSGSENIFTKFSKNVTNIFTDLYDKLIGNSIWTDTIDDINSYTNRLFSGAFSTITSWTDAILDKFNDIKDSIKDTFSGFKNKINFKDMFNFKQEKSLFTFSFAKTTGITSIFGKIVKGFKDVIKLVFDAVITLKLTFNKFVSDITGLSRDTITNLSQMLSVIGIFITKSIFGKLALLATTIGIALQKPKQNEAVQIIATTGGEIFDNFKDISSLKEFTTAFEDSIGDLTAGVSDLFTYITDKIDELKDLLSKGISKTVSVIMMPFIAFKDLLLSLATTISSLYVSMFTANKATELFGNHLKKVTENYDKIVKNEEKRILSPLKNQELSGDTIAQKFGANKLAEDNVSKAYRNVPWVLAFKEGIDKALTYFSTYLYKAIERVVPAGFVAAFSGTIITEELLKKLALIPGKLFQQFASILPKTAAYFGEGLIGAALKGIPGLVIALLSIVGKSIANMLTSEGANQAALGFAYTIGKFTASIVSDLIEGVLSNIVPAIIAIASKLPALITGFIAGIISSIPKILEALVTGIADIVSTIVRTIANSIVDLGKMIVSAVTLGLITFEQKPTEGFATGGHIRGAGTGTSDSILARLSNGEFVVNADATKKNRGLLENINNGSVPTFANGGAVDERSTFSRIVNPYDIDLLGFWKKFLSIKGYADGGIITENQFSKFNWGDVLDGLVDIETKTGKISTIEDFLSQLSETDLKLLQNQEKLIEEYIDKNIKSVLNPISKGSNLDPITSIKSMIDDIAKVMDTAINYSSKLDIGQGWSSIEPTGNHAILTPPITEKSISASTSTILHELGHTIDNNMRFPEYLNELKINPVGRLDNQKALVLLLRGIDPVENNVNFPKLLFSEYNASTAAKILSQKLNLPIDTWKNLYPGFLSYLGFGQDMFSPDMIEESTKAMTKPMSLADSLPQFFPSTIDDSIIEDSIKNLNTNDEINEKTIKDFIKNLNTHDNITDILKKPSVYKNVTDILKNPNTYKSIVKATPGLLGGLGGGMIFEHALGLGKKSGLQSGSENIADNLEGVLPVWARAGMYAAGTTGAAAIDLAANTVGYLLTEKALKPLPLHAKLLAALGLSGAGLYMASQSAEGYADGGMVDNRSTFSKIINPYNLDPWIFWKKFLSIEGYANGGHIQGVGTGTSDSIPAFISNGEYIVNANSTRKNKAFLDYINSGGTISTFAEGSPYGSLLSNNIRGVDLQLGLDSLNVTFTKTGDDVIDQLELSNSQLESLNKTNIAQIDALKYYTSTLINLIDPKYKEVPDTGLAKQDQERYNRELYLINRLTSTNLDTPEGQFNLQRAQNFGERIRSLESTLIKLPTEITPLTAVMSRLIREGTRRLIPERSVSRSENLLNYIQGKPNSYQEGLQNTRFRSIALEVANERFFNDEGKRQKDLIDSIKEIGIFDNILSTGLPGIVSNLSKGQDIGIENILPAQIKSFSDILLNFNEKYAIRTTETTPDTEKGTLILGETISNIFSKIFTQTTKPDSFYGKESARVQSVTDLDKAVKETGLIRNFFDTILGTGPSTARAQFQADIGKYEDLILKDFNEFLNKLSGITEDVRKFKFDLVSNDPTLNAAIRAATPSDQLSAGVAQGLFGQLKDDQRDNVLGYYQDILNKKGISINSDDMLGQISDFIGKEAGLPDLKIPLETFVLGLANGDDSVVRLTDDLEKLREQVVSYTLINTEQKLEGLPGIDAFIDALRVLFIKKRDEVLEAASQINLSDYQKATIDYSKFGIKVNPEDLVNPKNTGAADVLNSSLSESARLVKQRDLVLDHNSELFKALSRRIEELTNAARSAANQLNNISAFNKQRKTEAEDFLASVNPVKAVELKYSRMKEQVLGYSEPGSGNPPMSTAQRAAINYQLAKEDPKLFEKYAGRDLTPSIDDSTGLLRTDPSGKIIIGIALPDAEKAQAVAYATRDMNKELYEASEGFQMLSRIASLLPFDRGIIINYENQIREINELLSKGYITPSEANIATVEADINKNKSIRDSNPVTNMIRSLNDIIAEGNPILSDRLRKEEQIRVLSENFQETQARAISRGIDVTNMTDLFTQALVNLSSVSQDAIDSFKNMTNELVNMGRQRIIDDPRIAEKIRRKAELEQTIETIDQQFYDRIRAYSTNQEFLNKSVEEKTNILSKESLAWEQNKALATYKASDKFIADEVGRQSADQAVDAFASSMFDVFKGEDDPFGNLATTIADSFIDSLTQGFSTGVFETLFNGLLADFNSGLYEMGKNLGKQLGNLLTSLAKKVLETLSKTGGPSGTGGGWITTAANFGLSFFAEGGKIKGAGTGTSDSILARLSNGEYVVNADSTRKYLPMLEAINTNNISKFASGGLIPSGSIVPISPMQASDLVQREAANSSTEKTASVNYHNFNFSGIPDQTYIDQIRGIIAQSNRTTAMSAETYNRQTRSLRSR